MIKTLFISLFFPVMLLVTSADLLYLWSAGSWYDTYWIIEELEVAMLAGFVALSLVRIGYIVGRISWKA